MNHLQAVFLIGAVIFGAAAVVSIGAVMRDIVRDWMRKR